ncbi:hypothetical protein ACWD1W_30555 [Streptomyces olivaceoviridis]
MPEDKYNSGGFTQNSDGAIFSNLSDDLDRKDVFDSWDWKQIMAAILGSSQGGDTEENASHARSIAYWPSLQQAAEAFYFVQRTLEQVASVMADQTKALAGPDGPWRGDAADAFHDTMDSFSKRIAAAADALAGGKTGQHSVPQQLANNAVALKWAQETIVEIDHWYAQLSLQYGKYHGKSVSSMSDGRIPIHDVTVGGQLLEPMMQHDMYQVAASLSGAYDLTVDNVKLPGSVTGPGTDGNLDTPEQPKVDAPPDLGAGDGLTVPPVDTALGTGDGGGVPGFGGDTSVPGFDDAGGTASPFPGSTLATDPGGGVGDVPSFDPGNLDAALNPGGADGLDATASPFPGDTGLPGGDTSALPGGDLPSDFAASPYPGDTGLPGGDTSALPGGDLPNDFAASPYPGDTALPGGDTSTLPGDATAFPGDTSLAEGGQTPSTFAATPFPGLTSLPTGDTAAVPSTSSGLTDASASPFDDAGLPQDYPGDLGLGSSDAVPATGDLPTDTTLPSGLPGNVALESPGTLPGTTPQEFPGLGDAGAGVEQQAGGGMPYMPGVPGMGGAGAGQAAAVEPPDASGLLDASSVPWGGAVGGAGDVSEFGGVPLEPGVTGEAPGLDLPGTTPEEFPGLGDAGAGVEQQGGGGMPYMPGVPGMGGAGAGAGQAAAVEPPDASGLLDASSVPWGGAAGDVSEFGGVPVGPGVTGEAPGLDLPGTTPEEFPGVGAAGGQVAAAGGGMPYMPGVPGMGGAGAGQAAAVEPPDSSGLLEPDSRSWDEAPGEDPAEPVAGTVAAAGADGAALDLPVTGAAAGVWGAAALGALGHAPGGESRATGTGREVHASGHGAEPVLSASAWGDADHDHVPDGAGDAEATGTHVPVEPVTATASPSVHASAQGEPVTHPSPADEAGVAAAALGGAALGAAAALSARAEREDHRAGTPVIAPGGTEDPEDTAAWDRADPVLMPFLIVAKGGEPAEGGDGPRSRYSGEAPGAWSDVAVAGAASPAAPVRPTWQPGRSGAAAASSDGTVPLGSDQPLCGDFSAEELQAFDTRQADEAEADAEEEQKEPTFADLLVQRRDVWGDAGGDDDLG